MMVHFEEAVFEFYNIRLSYDPISYSTVYLAAIQKNRVIDLSALTV